MLTAQRLNSHSAGSCNFCSKQITPNGGVHGAVTEVKGDAPGGSLVVRFCDPCLQELKRQTGVAPRALRAPEPPTCTAFVQWLRTLGRVRMRTGDDPTYRVQTELRLGPLAETEGLDAMLAVGTRPTGGTPDPEFALVDTHDGIYQVAIFFYQWPGYEPSPQKCHEIWEGWTRSLGKGWTTITPRLYDSRYGCTVGTAFRARTQDEPLQRTL